jgi:hypothetical protein
MGLQLGEVLFRTAGEVVALLQRFAATDDGAALFVLSLVVSRERARVEYAPTPEAILGGLFSLLEGVERALCAIPVVPSAFCTIPGYAALRCVSAHAAKMHLEESKALLRRAFDAQASELLALRARYARYEFVLAEPYYVFPADWAADDNWRALRGDWERVFARARALADEVELVSENEEDVGIFLAVCSPPSLVLSGHAASLTPN